jgi:hypothetical protein
LDYNQKDANLGITNPSSAQKSNSGEQSTTSEDELGLIGSALGNLIAIKESKDKGLADMETGSEVYMSELLVSTHQENTRSIKIDKLIQNYFSPIGWLRH